MQKKLYTVKWYDACNIEHQTPELEIDIAVDVLYACLISSVTGYLLNGGIVYGTSLETVN